MNPYPHPRPAGQTADPRLQDWSGTSPAGGSPTQPPASTPATPPAGAAPNTQNPGGSPPPNTWGPQTYGFDPRTMAGRQVTPDLAWYFGQDAVGRTIGNDGTAMAGFRPPADGLGGRVPRDNRMGSPVATPAPPSPISNAPVDPNAAAAYGVRQRGYTAPAVTTPPATPAAGGTPSAVQTRGSPNEMVNPPSTVIGGPAGGTPNVTAPEYAGGRGNIVNAMLRPFDRRRW